MLSRYEVDGLMVGVMTSDAVPTGETNVSHWLNSNMDFLGRPYVSELRCNYRHLSSTGDRAWSLIGLWIASAFVLHLFFLRA